jgi:hypothetical protein
MNWSSTWRSHTGATMEQVGNTWKLHLERHSKNCECSICHKNQQGFIIPQAWNAFNAWYRFAWRTRSYNYYVVGLRSLLPFSKRPERHYRTTEGQDE